MPESISILIDGIPTRLEPGTTVCAAMLMAGVPARISVGGSPRAALCGMGICFECCAVVDGIPHRRTCQLACAEGMTVETQR